MDKSENENVLASLDQLMQQVLEHLATGLTIGDMRGFDEGDYETIYTVGHALYTQGRFADAAQVFCFLAIHKHLDRRYIVAYAAALQMSGDHGNAIRMYTLAAVMDMSDPTPCFHTCECLVALGLKKEAVEGLEIVVRQCERQAHRALRERAQAMLKILRGPA